MRFGFRRSDTAWAAAFILPYLAVFAGFVAYPVSSGLSMGARAELFSILLSDPLYRTTLVNTLLFTGVAVNLQMLLAFLLSGFFLRPGRWVKILLAIYLLPWALPALSAFISIHFMLVSRWGLLDSLWRAATGTDGPLFLTSRPLALGADIAAHLWKWMPFWTLVFIAARMAIPREIHEAAEIDGASARQRLIHVTFPMLANVYLACTLLSAIWAIGDFPTVYFVSSGAPARLTDVLSTYGFREAFNFGNPALGVAAMLTALPLLVPLAVLLMRRARRGVQL